MRGSRRDWCLEEGCHQYQMEISYSRFERCLTLPTDLERARVSQGSGVKHPYASETGPLNKMVKRIVAARNLTAGTKVSADDLEFKIVDHTDEVLELALMAPVLEEPVLAGVGRNTNGG